MIYGYIRVSTARQSLERQRMNIRLRYPDADIYEEKSSGKTDDRPVFQKLLKKAQKGDTIIFDEVSRMSRNASEGFQDYQTCLSKGISLKFLKEPQIDSEVYLSAKDSLITPVGNEIADLYIETTNKLLMILAEKQIRAAFERSEAERVLLSQRTKEGLRRSNKKPGRIPGVPQHTKKELAAKKIMRKRCKEFGGNNSNVEVMKLAGISSQTFYKYLKELRGDAAQRQMDIDDFVKDDFVRISRELT